jgi:Notch 1
VGQRCEGDVNECLENSCSTIGTQACVQLINHYRCDCKPGWAGKFCEHKVDICPCQNGGVCGATGHSLRAFGSKITTTEQACICAAGYHGEFCNLTGSPCDSNPCLNGGACLIRGDGKFQCRCPRGTEGEFCSKDNRIDCTLQPCQNGGKCSIKPNGHGYSCSCPSLWRGKNCEIFDPQSPGDLITLQVVSYEYHNLCRIYNVNYKFNWY